MCIPKQTVQRTEQNITWESVFLDGAQKQAMMRIEGLVDNDVAYFCPPETVITLFP